MGDDRLSKITEGQRACLRFVFMHLSSKDIARELGISPHTVDQRIRVAIQQLGVTSRVEAARLLAASEGVAPYQPTIYQSPHIAMSPPAASYPASANAPERTEGCADEVTGIGLAAMDTALPPRRQHARMPFPSYKGERNDLDLMQRLGWIIAIAIGSTISFGTLLAGLDALSRIL
jgi:DNA-binding CsgD family transcriptional regulator